MKVLVNVIASIIRILFYAVGVLVSIIIAYYFFYYPVVKLIRYITM